MTRLFLAIVGLIFLGYGIACATDPTLPSRLAGLGIINGDGLAELAAMYGGLQSGVGLFLLLAAARANLREPALLLLLLGIGLLAAMRAVGILTTSNIVTSYSWAALAFETLVTAIAAALLTAKR
ncbi:MAG: DUF4345 family protein [Pseudomonadota bacterium]